MIELSTLIIASLAACTLAVLLAWSKSKKSASKATATPASCEEVNTIALSEPESASVAVQAAEFLDVPIPGQLPIMPMDDYHPGRAVNLTALLRDLDAVFPQIPVKPTTTIEEIQFNAGQRCLADWMRQQYLSRGKQAGSMSKAASI